MKIKFIAKWYDLWVGMYWDSKIKHLYILPFPCLGIVLDFRKTIDYICGELDGKQ